MGKLLKTVRSKMGGGTGRGGKNPTGDLSGYTGNILDKNLQALTGKKLRRQRNSSGVQELLGGS